MEKSYMVYSPGRINLIGEYIDFNGGNVLPMCIDRGTYAKVKINKSDEIMLFSSNFTNFGKSSFEYAVELEKTNEWTDYVKAMFYVFKKHGYENKYGMNIEIFGTIPNGSGLSSSASLEVLVGKIINKVNDFKISDEKIALMAQEAENEFIGVNCGIMDPFIIANGKKGFALKLDCNTIKYEHIPIDLGDYCILIANSNKKRGLVDSAYNERRAQCDEVLAKAQEKFNVTNLCEVTMEQLNSLSLNEVLYKRARHAITEQIRVNEMIEALEHNNVEKVGLILNASHQSLREDFEVSCAEIDFIMESSIKLGAKGARIIGAGFGGCGIILVHRKDEQKIVGSLQKEYLEKFDLNLEIFATISSEKTTVYKEV